MLTAGSQPDVAVIGESGSLTDQLTTTKLPYALPRYQSFVPRIPVMLYETTGGVPSAATAADPGTASSGTAAAATKQNARTLRVRCIGRRRMSGLLRSAAGRRKR